MELLKNFKLKENEELLRVVYHHPIVVVPHLVVCFIILVLDFFLMYYLFLQGWWGVLLFGAIIVVVAFYFGRMIFLFRRNRVIITNQRIVDHEQAGFFEKYVSEVSFYKLRKVEAVVKGIGPTVFGYGNIRLSVQGEGAPFELYKLPKPLKLQNLINQYLKERPEAQEAEEEELNEEKGEEGINRRDGQEAKDSVASILAQTEALSRREKRRLVIKLKKQIMLEKEAEKEVAEEEE